MFPPQNYECFPRGNLCPIQCILQENKFPCRPRQGNTETQTIGSVVALSTHLDYIRDTLKKEKLNKGHLMVGAPFIVNETFLTSPPRHD